MKPAQTINVLDAHGGFTAITKSKGYEKEVDAVGNFVRWNKVYRELNTFWRPSQLLKGKTEGELQEYDEHSFYQNNENVTKAIYKVKGYCNRVVVWFDNETGLRIA